MPAVVSFENVSFSYPTTRVLSHVSFAIQSGEYVGVIGPNGGGKTTLLKLIMGFLKPTHGKIQLFGKSQHDPAIQHKLAYVPQAMRFDRQFPISVLEVVLSGLLSHLPWYGRFLPEHKQAALEALNQVDMHKLAYKAFGTLSGGQAQRVLIARALVSKPELLLLDEPTASVDSQAETEIYRILEQLKGKMTIIMVTHNLRAAIDQVQRVLCVQGEVFSLKPEEVCEHFAIGLYHAPLIQNLGKKGDA